MRLISVYDDDDDDDNDDDDDDDDDDDYDSYKQLNCIIFPFLVVIKQSQASPYSSTSLTTKSPQVRTVPLPIINRLPATSSLFHPKVMVSSSAHQSFPSSSSAQIKGKAKKVYFVNDASFSSVNVHFFLLILQFRDPRYCSHPVFSGIPKSGVFQISSCH